MAELLVAPDVVALVCVWLRTQLPTIPDQTAVPVHRAVPSPRPASFVTVRLLGGAGRDPALPVTDRASVAVEAESWMTPSRRTPSMFAMSSCVMISSLPVNRSS